MPGWTTTTPPGSTSTRSPRLAEQHRQRAAQRDEDLLLIRVEVPPPARVRRIAPHPRARLGHLRGLGERGGLPRLLALVAGPLLPVEVGVMDDVPAHGATIPSAPWPSRDRSRRRAAAGRADDRPARRRVDPLLRRALLARASRSGSRPPRWPSSSRSVSRRIAVVLAPTLSARSSARPTSARACSCSSSAAAADGSSRRGSIGWLVFAPVPFLVLLFIVPGLALARGARARRPGHSSSRTSPCASALAARLAARSSRLPARDRLASSRSRSSSCSRSRCSSSSCAASADAAVSVAFFLASVVLSPLLFVGTALLYVDQAARVEQ